MQYTIQRRMHTMAGTESILKLCKMLKAKQGKKKDNFWSEEIAETEREDESQQD